MNRWGNSSTWSEQAFHAGSVLLFVILSYFDMWLERHHKRRRDQQGPVSSSLMSWEEPQKQLYGVTWWQVYFCSDQTFVNTRMFIPWIMLTATSTKSRSRKDTHRNTLSFNDVKNVNTSFYSGLQSSASKDWYGKRSAFTAGDINRNHKNSKCNAPSLQRDLPSILQISCDVDIGLNLSLIRMNAPSPKQIVLPNRNAPY